MAVVIVTANITKMKQNNQINSSVKMANMLAYVRFKLNIPNFDTEDELIAYLLVHPNAKLNMHYLVVSYDSTFVLDWLEKHDLLNTDYVMRQIAAYGSAELMQCCKDKGFDTSGYCDVAFRHQRRSMLEWLQHHGCCCDKTSRFHELCRCGRSGWCNRCGND
jgi:hypothetical protein